MACNIFIAVQLVCLENFDCTQREILKRILTKNKKYSASKVLALQIIPTREELDIESRIRRVNRSDLYLEKPLAKIYLIAFKKENKISISELKNEVCKDFWYYQSERDSLTWNVSTKSVTIWIYHNGAFDIKKGKNI